MAMWAYHNHHPTLGTLQPRIRIQKEDTERTTNTNQKNHPNHCCCHGKQNTSFDSTQHTPTLPPLPLTTFQNLHQSEQWRTCAHPRNHHPRRPITRTLDTTARFLPHHQQIDHRQNHPQNHHSTQSSPKQKPLKNETDQYLPRPSDSTALVTNAPTRNHTSTAEYSW